MDSHVDDVPVSEKVILSSNAQFDLIFNFKIFLIYFSTVHSDLVIPLISFTQIDFNSEILEVLNVEQI